MHDTDLAERLGIFLRWSNPGRSWTSVNPKVAPNGRTIPCAHVGTTSALMCGEASMLPANGQRHRQRGIRPKLGDAAGPGGAASWARACRGSVGQSPGRTSRFVESQTELDLLQRNRESPVIDSRSTPTTAGRCLPLVGGPAQPRAIPKRTHPTVFGPRWVDRSKRNGRVRNRHRTDLLDRREMPSDDDRLSTDRKGQAWISSKLDQKTTGPDQRPGSFIRHGHG
jgi:hypothetical protein